MGDTTNFPFNLLINNTKTSMLIQILIFYLFIFKNKSLIVAIKTSKCAISKVRIFKQEYEEFYVKYMQYEVAFCLGPI